MGASQLFCVPRGSWAASVSILQSRRPRVLVGATAATGVLSRAPPTGRRPALPAGPGLSAGPTCHWNLRGQPGPAGLGEPGTSGASPGRPAWGAWNLRGQPRQAGLGGLEPQRPAPAGGLGPFMWSAPNLVFHQNSQGLVSCLSDNWWFLSKR